MQSDNAWETADKLRTLPGVADVTLFGAELHATLKPGVEITTTKQLLRESVRYQVTFTEVVPTLEDLFIALTREEHK